MIAGYFFQQHQIRIFNTLSDPFTLRIQPSHSLSKEAIEKTIAAFEALEGWSWNANQGSWETYFEAVRLWMREVPPAATPADKLWSWFPHENPAAWITGDERTHEVMLGKWINNQKYLNSKGKLKEERCALLQGLPGGTWSSRILGAQQEQLMIKEAILNRGRQS